MRGHRFDPWPGRIPHAEEHLSPCATTPKARGPRACAQEKPPQWEPGAPQPGGAPTRHNQRKPTRGNQDPAQLKRIAMIIIIKTFYELPWWFRV